MNPNDPQTKRKVLILTSVIDMFIAGLILLIYFRLLPIDTASWGIPRSVIGWVGAVWFFLALGMLVYQLTKPDISE